MNELKTEDSGWDLAAPPTTSGSLEPKCEVDSATNLVPFSSRLDPDLKHKLKMYSVQRGRSIIEILDQMLTAYLEGK